MPHVIVKLWPKPEPQKRALADAITQTVAQQLGYGEDAVSVSVEEIAPADWTEKVSKPDILDGPGTLYKKPGYGPS
jgi:4-oxalocrotonate tautomerase